MTRTVFIDKTGGPEVFEIRDRVLDAPGPGELRIRNNAISLNFIDIYKRKGLYPVTMPAVLGEEGVGVVEAVGADAGDFRPGDRVAYLTHAGAYGEETLATAATTAKVPAGIDDDIAAAGFLKGLTVDMLVRDVFALGPQHVCLVYAAAGGVGALLTQRAHHIGARVIAIVGSAAKADIARSAGAQDVIIRTETDKIDEAVRDLTDGRGVDVAYDSIGAATFEASLNALARRGHMVTYGNASGPAQAIAPLELARRGSLTLTRPTLFDYLVPDRLPEMAARFFQLVQDGVLRPAIDKRFQLADIAEAHRYLESGKNTGSVVILP